MYLTTIDEQFAAAMQQGAAATAQGRLAVAEEHYRRACALQPVKPDAAIGLGQELRHLGRPADAKAQFASAIQLSPTLADAQYGLGLACQDMLDIEDAESAYRAALTHQPSFLPAALSLAMLYNSKGRPDEALALMETASASDANLAAVIELARGTANLMKAQNEEALACFGRALASRPGFSDAIRSRAVAQQALGREDEALAGLRQAVRENPFDVTVHNDLNQMLYRLNRDGEFLRSYDEAAATYPGRPQFVLAKAALLVRAERAAEALDLYEQALKMMPGEPNILQGRAMAQLKLQQVDDAIASYQEGLKRAPQNINLLTGAAAAYSMARRPKEAEDAALRALQLVPADQTALAVLGTAWRLMGDEREWDLNRYDDFIQVFDLDPPPGFNDMAEFSNQLNGWLGMQHRDAREHIDQSLRRGTQTAGHLFQTGCHALLDGLRLRIEEALRAYIERLPHDARHPFLRRRRRNFSFTGSWSSRLKNEGFHANHLHPAGWISSAFYVALPDVVKNTGDRQGWLKFGEPAYDVGLGDPVRSVVQPKVGRLVLFPSYMWHGTIPFHDLQDRTTISFDVVPTK